MIDYHVHTNYSADASATVTEQLEAAAERGLSEICFTDHVDFDNGDKSMQPSDLGALREQLLPYNGLYKGVRIRRGAEVALNDGNCAEKAPESTVRSSCKRPPTSEHASSTENPCSERYFTCGTRN